MFCNVCLLRMKRKEVLDRRGFDRANITYSPKAFDCLKQDLLIVKPAVIDLVLKHQVLYLAALLLDLIKQRRYVARNFLG